MEIVNLIQVKAEDINLRRQAIVIQQAILVQAIHLVQHSIPAKIETHIFIWVQILLHIVTMPMQLELGTFLSTGQQMVN